MSDHNKREIIHLENVFKIYNIGHIRVEALKAINMVVDEGEYVAIMGPSGSGKSTMMNIIGCLDRPTEGEYYFEGERVGGLSDDKLAYIRNKKVGFVFQTFNLLPRRNAISNVELPLVYAGVPAEDRKRRAMDALSKVDLVDRAKHNPSEMSGGERQRVAIARAIVNEPAIILADEPTGNLDTRTGNEIMDVFRSINEEGNTILMVTHDPDIARHARRIIQLRDGEIVSDKITGKK